MTTPALMGMIGGRNKYLAIPVLFMLLVTVVAVTFGTSSSPGNAVVFLIGLMLIGLDAMTILVFAFYYGLRKRFGQSLGLLCMLLLSAICVVVIIGSRSYRRRITFSTVSMTHRYLLERLPYLRDSDGTFNADRVRKELSTFPRWNSRLLVIHGCIVEDMKISLYYTEPCSNTWSLVLPQPDDSEIVASQVRWESSFIDETSDRGVP